MPKLCFFRLITPENFKWYVLALVLGPAVFYSPKFFEVRAVVDMQPVHIPFNCSSLGLFDFDEEVRAKRRLGVYDKKGYTS